MKNNNIILYAAILIFGVLAPFMLPAFKVQLSILCILIVLALTWNIQGGEMGYNTFGNILFYGLGMYLCASVQVGMFFPYDPPHMVAIQLKTLTPVGTAITIVASMK